MQRKAQTGFTLIEILVVCAVIFMLASIIFASLSTAREKARIAGAMQFERSLQSAAGAQEGGFWTFSEGGGTTIVDSFGNGSTGTLTPGTGGFVSGAGNTPTDSGYALRLDGTTTYVNIAPNSAFSAITNPGTPGFAIAAWFKASGLPQSGYDGYIVFRIGYHEGLMMNLEDGEFMGVLWFSDNTALVLDSNVNLNDGKWHHLAMSVNDQSKKFTLYLDGRAVASATYTKVLRNYGTGAYAIGGSGTYKAYGILDNAMIFGQPIN